ncbi:MAG TPA: Holliday junction resolvase-like protein [Candidatus Methanofastidiosa archaeon]|nr:Holliday junction resolvase-like protein [Candidatus Methanofastidiosa archaeon]
MSNREWSKRIPEIRKDATKRSRAVLTGQFCEQLAPYMPGFAYSPTEARFIGKPIDLIVFEGMDKGCIDGLVFIEVKSGNSRLSSIEKELKGAIEEGKVRWEEYRV